ncbi:NAD-dependent epimerase/dehydratase family protein [Aquibium carbonis]|uniref:NAD-dependent epimerase/dehydratase family protein n=1 Tax=Aquibium carbonis TaxID=2495581 RepID=A0A3R9YGB2_9HYPH|nr:GDP-mannose 4,6-dehydratase [Aquibium carbonis]RST78603.1 NAD-dependent epimerase/dehydratase family protein [Aquibium carbonis]
MSRTGGIVVTGAGGFIGSHLAEAALAAGLSTTLMLRYSSQGGIGNLVDLDPDTLSRADMVWGDITDGRSLARIIEGADAVVHLAALIGIPYSLAAPESYVATNVTGTLNVLEAARLAGVGRVVLVSTSEVYGDAETAAIDETHPLKPQSPYAATKVAAEALGRAWHQSFDLPVTIIRPFNTFGPRQSRRAVIPTIIAQALRGDGLRLGSLWPQRDFTYAADTAAALLTAATAGDIGLGPYNLGTGRSVSVADVVEIVGQILGRRLEVETDPERIRPASGEVDRLTADNRRFREATGWGPRLSLEEGIARTIDQLRRDDGRSDGHRRTDDYRV